ncbi:extracellular triacylglycerol lipase precursor [Daedaleopsis nitida]|nr:extracellular triacylglycerol lipase precursor [Daedaleopsis nitida]
MVLPVFQQGHALRTLTFVTSALAGFSKSAQAQPPQVPLSSGMVVGTSQLFAGAVGVDFFGGIPFAAPPLGDLRFAPPVFNDTLPTSEYNATAYGSPCLQFSVEGVSEDCLTLNVYRSSGISNTSALPVMVWIYGGAFLQGESSIYNASGIIAKSVVRGTPVVYVSINYRVGPFGFPQGDEADLRGAVNLGLKDQLAGLQWVQKHISAFGGDPSKVTIFGQSSGAISIGLLYLNSGLEKYARAAIFESGSASTTPLFNASRREVAWDTFASNVPACADAARGDTFSCMQSTDTATLLNAWRETAASFPEPFLYVPVIDGPDGIIPDLPSKLFAAGNFSNIPFIAGTVLDEGTDFIPESITTEEQAVQFLLIDDQPFGDPPPSFEQDVASILQLYPDVPALGSPYGTGNETFGLSSQYKRVAAILGDASFHGPRRAWTQAASAAGVKTFGYLFDDQKAVVIPSKGVAHTSELPFVYGLTALTSPDAGEQLLSQAILDYWISFAVSLTPNDGKGVPRTIWPEYRHDNQVLLQFDTLRFVLPSVASLSIVPDTYRSKQIAFLNSIAEDLRE